jgi:hypothetical protein
MPEIRISAADVETAREWGERVMLKRMGIDPTRPYSKIPIDPIGNGVDEWVYQQLDGTEKDRECLEAGLLDAMSNRKG